MKKIVLIFCFSFLTSGFFFGCAHHKKQIPLPADPLLFSWIQSTVPDSPMTGKASFWLAGDAVKIRIVVTGAKPGLHGVHVHEKGDCADAGNAAGGHFNPDHVNHGNVIKDGFKHAHPGDLGNITVDSTGLGVLDITVPRLTLDHGPYGIAGRSIIVHENADDFGQPTGNAGGRVACALIPSPAAVD